jgi:hypothetical protein
MMPDLLPSDLRERSAMLRLMAAELRVLTVRTREQSADAHARSRYLCSLNRRFIVLLQSYRYGDAPIT